jgi:dihydrofolate reductase
LRRAILGKYTAYNMKRPRTSGFVGVSLDGFLARTDGSIDWLKPFEGEDHGFHAFFATVDTVVFGRRTYEFVLSMLSSGLSWPYAERRCVVMTHRPIEQKNGERTFSGEPDVLLRDLEAAGAQHVYVDGGVVLRSFLSAGLLDQLTVSVVPVLLGTGFPLFGGVSLESGLTLENSASFKNGLVQMRYGFRKAAQAGAASPLPSQVPGRPAHGG